VLFADWSRKRQRFVPLYLLIWILIIAGLVFALSDLGMQ
jgi:hypothetical protein